MTVNDDMINYLLEGDIEWGLKLKIMWLIKEFLKEIKNIFEYPQTTGQWKLNFINTD